MGASDPWMIRIDEGTLRASKKTPQGFLQLEGFIARPGVYAYINKPEDEKAGLGKTGETRYELRPDEEVFNEDSLSEYEGAPITLYHPGKMLTPENVRAYEVGSVMAGARREGGRVAVSMVVKDKKAIASIESNKTRRLSPGYKMHLEKTRGVDPKYGRYDFIQRDIVPNHVAFVDRARGGDDLQVRMDGADVSVASAQPREDDCATLLTSAVDGHQHTIWLDTDDSAGRTSCAVSEGADTDHFHMWIRNADGTMTIAEDSGHTHDVIGAAVPPPDPVTVLLAEYAATMLPADARADKADVASVKIAGDVAKKSAYSRSDKVSAASPRQENKTMDKDEQIRSLKAQLADAETKAETSSGALAVTSERADRAEARITTLEEEKTELATKLAAGSTAAESVAIKAQSERADQAEAKIATFTSTFEDAVKARCSVMHRARNVMGTSFRMDRMDVRDIQAVVIKKLRPAEDVGPQKTPEYIAGRFDSLIESWDKTARSHIELGDVIAEGDMHSRTDAADSGRGSGTSPQVRKAAWRNQAFAPNTQIKASRTAGQKGG